jgi:hypothetical protein
MKFLADNINNNINMDGRKRNKSLGYDAGAQKKEGRGSESGFGLKRFSHGSSTRMREDSGCEDNDQHQAFVAYVRAHTTLQLMSVGGQGFLFGCMFRLVIGFLH